MNSIDRLRNSPAISNAAISKENLHCDIGNAFIGLRVLRLKTDYRRTKRTCAEKRNRGYSWQPGKFAFVNTNSGIRLRWKKRGTFQKKLLEVLVKSVGTQVLVSTSIPSAAKRHKQRGFGLFASDESFRF